MTTNPTNREIMIRTAKMFSGNTSGVSAGINWETTGETSLLLLIEDSIHHTQGILEKIVVKNHALLQEMVKAADTIEHLNKMFCVNCGACGTTTEYASCDCGGEEE